MLSTPPASNPSPESLETLSETKIRITIRIFDIPDLNCVTFVLTFQAVY